MKLRTLRRLVVLLLLVVSLVFLIWGLWPGIDVTRVMPISPLDMQLPTPTGWLPPLWMAG